VSHGFQRCPYEHTLYIKFVEPGNIFIVCLYVDDLIFTDNNSMMIVEFRKAMTHHIEMIDLDLMSYFLGIEVIHRDYGILFFKRNMQVTF
jgi:hypothetical protein